MSETRLMHATAVGFRDAALLLRGPSGAGKSDLAFRLLSLAPAPVLIADDQVRLFREGVAVMATAPETIRGLLEVRGLGIVPVPVLDMARVRLVIDLVPLVDVPRMPLDNETVDLLGVLVPRLRLYAFEASAPLKCAHALNRLR